MLKAKTDNFIKASTKFVSSLLTDQVELIKVNKTTLPRRPKRSPKYISSTSRSFMSQCHIPKIETFRKADPDQGDLHATPAGIRMLYEEWLRRSISTWFKNWSEKHIPDKLFKVMVAPYTTFQDGKMNELKLTAGGGLCMYRGMHTVYTTTLPVPQYRQTPFAQVDWQGLYEHVILHFKEDEPVGPELAEEFRACVKEVLRAWPLPGKWYDELSTNEWFYKIRTNSNSGFPHYVKQNSLVYVEDINNVVPAKDGQDYRDWMWNEYSEIVQTANFEDWLLQKIIYTVFKRNQPTKDRLVSGAMDILKIFGAAINSIILKYLGDNKSNIAWGQHDDIFGDIRQWHDEFSDGGVISVDFSKLDLTFKFQYMEIIIEELTEAWSAVDPVYEKVFEFVKHCMMDEAYLLFGPDHMAKIKTGLLSGTPLTQFFDSILVAALTIMFMRRNKMDIRYKVLGDDLVWYGPSDILEVFDDWIDVTADYGLKVSLNKSYPGLTSDTFSIFLQYITYSDLLDKARTIGNAGRKLSSLICRERDSSLVKSMDVDAYMNDPNFKWKHLWLIRSLQILASFLPDAWESGFDEVVSWYSRYDKFINSKKDLEAAVGAFDKYQSSDDEWWKATAIHPNKVIPYLTA
jgi:hypothetical protein